MHFIMELGHRNKNHLARLFILYFFILILKRINGTNLSNVDFELAHMQQASA